MIKKLRSCFSAEASNIGRQLEVDTAKSLAAIFMVITHTYEMFSGWDYPLGVKILYQLFGGPLSATVFMFCMGLSICYSRNNTPSNFFRRGIKLLMAGLVIALLRCILPALLSFLADGYPSFVEDLPYLLLEMISEVDILQFAGIFFLAFALLRKANFTARQMLLLALLFVSAGQLLRDVETDHFYLDIVLGYFWKNSVSSWFPFFNWFIIPISGYVFGNIWRHCSDKRNFYRILTPGAFLLAMIYFVMSSGYSNLKYYYGLGMIEAVFSLLTALAVLGISYSITCRFPQIMHRFRYLSEELTPIYFAHRVLIPNIYMLIAVLTGCPDYFISDFGVILMGIAILVLSCWLTACHKVLFKTN